MRYNPITLADIRRPRPREPERVVPIVPRRESELLDHYLGSPQLEPKNVVSEPANPNERMLSWKLVDDQGTTLARSDKPARFKRHADRWYLSERSVDPGCDATGVAKLIIIYDDVGFVRVVLPDHFCFVGQQLPFNPFTLFFRDLDWVCVPKSEPKPKHEVPPGATPIYGSGGVVVGYTEILWEGIHR